MAMSRVISLHRHQQQLTINDDIEITNDETQKYKKNPTV